MCNVSSSPLATGRAVAAVAVLMPESQLHLAPFVVRSARVLAGAVSLAILGCASPVPARSTAARSSRRRRRRPPRPLTRRTADGVPDVNLSGALLYQLMAAEVAAQRGELGTAYAVYLKLARDTRDPRLARRATELALQGRALGESLEAAKLWHELAPRSSEASQTVAMLYAASGKFDEAHAIFSEQLKAAAPAGGRTGAHPARADAQPGSRRRLRAARAARAALRQDRRSAAGARQWRAGGRAEQPRDRGSEGRRRARPGLRARRADRRAVHAGERSPRRPGPAGALPGAEPEGDRSEAGVCAPAHRRQAVRTPRAGSSSACCRRTRRTRTSSTRWRCCRCRATSRPMRAATCSGISRCSRSRATRSAMPTTRT